MARPSKRTEATETAILLALADGRTKRDAASLGGIGYSTLSEWEATFPAFAEAVQNALEKAKNDLIATIQAASKPSGKNPGQWQAAAWLLERRWPKEFARTDRVEMTIDMAGEAQKLASEMGLNEAEILSEAQAILSERR